jgi:hypothetical protein
VLHACACNRSNGDCSGRRRRWQRARQRICQGFVVASSGKSRSCVPDQALSIALGANRYALGRQPAVSSPGCSGAAGRRPGLFFTVHWPSLIGHVQAAIAGCCVKAHRLAAAVRPTASDLELMLNRSVVSWMREPHVRVIDSSSCTTLVCTRQVFGNFLCICFPGAQFNHGSILELHGVLDVRSSTHNALTHLWVQFINTHREGCAAWVSQCLHG